MNKINYLIISSHSFSSSGECLGSQGVYKQVPSSLLAVGSKFEAFGSVQPSGTGIFTCWAALPGQKIKQPKSLDLVLFDQNILSNEFNFDIV